MPLSQPARTAKNRPQNPLALATLCLAGSLSVYGLFSTLGRFLEIAREDSGKSCQVLVHPAYGIATASLPAIVEIARKIGTDVVSLIKRTDPSARHAFIPPGWRLPPFPHVRSLNL